MFDLFFLWLVTYISICKLYVVKFEVYLHHSFVKAKYFDTDCYDSGFGFWWQDVFEQRKGQTIHKCQNDPAILFHNKNYGSSQNLIE